MTHMEPHVSQVEKPSCASRYAFRLAFGSGVSALLFLIGGFAASTRSPLLVAVIVTALWLFLSLASLVAGVAAVVFGVRDRIRQRRHRQGASSCEPERWRVLRVAYQGVFLLAYVGVMIVSLLLAPIFIGPPVLVLISGYAVAIAALGDRCISRSALNWWLLAAVPAVGLTLICIALRFPIRLPRVDAHGFGASGGEMNLVLFPWFQTTVYLLGQAALRRMKTDDR